MSLYVLLCIGCSCASILQLKESRRALKSRMMVPVAGVSRHGILVFIFFHALCEVSETEPVYG